MKPLPLVAAAVLAFELVRRRERLGRPMLAAGALALAALVVYGVGLVALPDFKSLIIDLGRALGPYTYVFVGVMAFLETGAFVGLIAPGETTILVGGVIAGQGEIDIVPLVALVWACAVAGDVTSFVLGRRLGRDFMLRHGPKVKVTPERLEQVERFFDHHGGKAILLGRFVGLVRAIAPFIAGASRMPLARFLPYDVIGAGLWSATFCLLGYVFWQSFDQVANIAGRGAFALGTVIALTTLAVVAYRRLRARGGLRRLPAPLRVALERFTPGDLGLELTTLVAVLAVGSFAFAGYLVTVDPTLVTGGDRRAFRLAAQLRTEWLIDGCKIVTTLGSLPAVGGAVLAAAVVLGSRRRWLETAVLIIGLVLTYAGVHIAKGAEGRPRPADAFVESLGSSYPSGHAAYAVVWVAVAVALARSLPAFAERFAIVAVALVLAAAIGLTRVILRAHYFSDVLGGWGLGAALLSACAIGALVADARIRHHRGVR